jgi:hypothetical protein
MIYTGSAFLRMALAVGMIGEILVNERAASSSRFHRRIVAVRWPCSIATDPASYDISGNFAYK